MEEDDLVVLEGEASSSSCYGSGGATGYPQNKGLGPAHQRQWAVAGRRAQHPPHSAADRRLEVVRAGRAGGVQRLDPVIAEVGDVD